MDNILKEVEENISGIWENDRYELVFGLDFSFFFNDKKNDLAIDDGKYSIVVENGLIVLRLNQKDYVLIELSAFKSLTISDEGEEIHLKNTLPDEYDGEVFNPANN